MRVLVVEDDRALGVFLQKGMALAGHDAEWVGDGETALERAAEVRPDLIVLDLGLPRRDGVEVLAAMRALAPNTSVLVLTGRTRLDERIRCLDLGADDFLLKPFSFHELAARCRAILRRKERFAEPVLRFADVEINLLDRSVRRAGIAVELTGKEFALLEFLMRKQGACCGRGELLREVWKVAPDTATNVVDVYVNYLRRKLGTVRSSHLPAVETVRGEGYRMRALPAVVQAIPSARIPPMGLGLQRMAQSAYL